MGINYCHKELPLRYGRVPFSAPGSTHMDTSQLICFVNHFSVFYMSLTVVLSGLMRFLCKIQHSLLHAIEIAIAKLLL